MALSGKTAKSLSLAAALGLTMTAASVLSVRPAQAADSLSQAIQKYNAKDYQTALNEFKAVYSHDPKNSLCRYYMALCNQCLARVDEAKKDYKWVVDNGAPNLKANAQAGLAQLDKVNVRTGGSTMTASTTSSAATTAPATGGKSGPDLIETSKDANGKDMAKGTAKDAAGKDGGKDAGKSGATAGKAAASGEKVAKVINFYSDVSRTCQLMEPAWDEIKGKYPKISFQKVNAGDSLCEKFNVTEFPTVIVVDKNGKVLATQPGLQSAEAMATTIDSCNK